RTTGWVTCLRPTPTLPTRVAGRVAAVRPGERPPGARQSRAGEPGNLYHTAVRLSLDHPDEDSTRTAGRATAAPGRSGLTGSSCPPPRTSSPRGSRGSDRRVRTSRDGTGRRRQAQVADDRLRGAQEPPAVRPRLGLKNRHLTTRELVRANHRRRATP